MISGAAVLLWGVAALLGTAVLAISARRRSGSGTRLTGVAFGEPRGSTAPAEASYTPMYSHLALVFAAGIYLAPPLVTWFQHVANLLG